MKLLSKEEILKIPDIQFEEVEVPEWGGRVRVKTLNGKERDTFEAGLTIHEGKKVRFNLQDVRARLVALSVVGEDGQRLFSDEDVLRLGEKSGKALDRIYDVACRLSGLGEKEIEGLLKNSPPGQSAGSGSS